MEARSRECAFAADEFFITKESGMTTVNVGMQFPIDTGNPEYACAKIEQADNSEYDPIAPKIQKVTAEYRECKNGHENESVHAVRTSVATVLHG